MRCVLFLPKIITLYSGNKKEFDYKNNHRYNKPVNLWLDHISIIIAKY